MARQNPLNQGPGDEDDAKQWPNDYGTLAKVAFARFHGKIMKNHEQIIKKTKKSEKRTKDIEKNAKNAKISKKTLELSPHRTFCL